jgi:large subunit ribosomal protein L19
MANHTTFQDKSITVGDRILVHQKIEEEGKTRTQIFEGICIAIKGRGVGKTFTVRKIGAANIGVERIFPVASPFIQKIEIKSRGHVRRAKLYYLRSRIGRKATRVKEKKSYTQADKPKHRSPNPKNPPNLAATPQA